MLNNTLFFSIIVPTYNRAKFLPQTLNSVINQKYQHWECIVVDDGSKDETKHIIERLIQNEKRIKYIYQENAERCVARNNGISNAKGDFICFLDSDDLFLDNHLEILAEAINDKGNPKALFFTNAFIKDDNGLIQERQCPDLGNDVADYILNYTFNPARVCIHQDIVRIEKFDPKIPGLEDLEMWLRISTKYPVYQIKKRTIIYNLHGETYTLGDAKRYQKELNYFYYIFNKDTLKDCLRKSSKNRLLSMCHFHLAQIAFQRGERAHAFGNIIASILKYPKGYKPGLLKITLVIFAYNFPIIGKFIRKLVQKKRRVTIPLPHNIEADYLPLMEKYATYSVRETRPIHKKNILVTPEGLFGKYGILNPYCTFNLRGFKDNNFYYSFSRLFLEQSIVSLKGRSLKRIPIFGKSLVIHSKWFNYGFWLNSSLVRLLLAEKEGLLNDVELVYPKSWESISYINESLSLFPKLKIREVPNDQMYVCEELYFHEVRQYTGSLNPDHVKMLRDEIPKKLGINLVEPFRKVYITRKKRGVRMPANEDKIITLLMRKGYEIVDFDGLNFGEQVKLMTQTKHLVSIHGAGMANMNFMQKGTSVLELINEPYAKAEYTFPFWKLGTLNELNYFTLFCPVADKTKLKLINSDRSKIVETDFLVNQNIIVDIEKLDSLTL